MNIRWKMLTLPLLLGAIASVLHADGPPLRPGAKASRIVVLKSKRKLQLLAKNEVLKTYDVSLGPEPIGHKTCEGDGRTPEGTYQIVGRNAKSQYHRSLRVSYPNDADRAHARKLGCSPGGDIMIHGLPNGYSWIGKGHLAKDWTAGCIAVTDKEIEEIWNAVDNGTAVEIRP